jgi:hypothetical protein
MGESRVVEIKRERIVEDSGQPGRGCPPASAPQVSSSQACMISICRPSPSGGTAIRTRTGNRRSVCCRAWIDARVMPHPLFMLCSEMYRTAAALSRDGVFSVGCRMSSPARVCDPCQLAHSGSTFTVFGR